MTTTMTSSLQSESIRSLSSVSVDVGERSLLRHYRNRAKNFFICCKASDQSKKIKKNTLTMENETQRKFSKAANHKNSEKTNKKDEVEEEKEEKQMFETIITTSTTILNEKDHHHHHIAPRSPTSSMSPTTSLHKHHHYHPTAPNKINTTRSSPTVQQVRNLQTARHNSEVLRKQHRMQIKQIAFLLALSMLTTMYVICRDKSEQCYYVQLIGLVMVCFITSLTYFLLRHRKFKPMSSVVTHINMTSSGTVTAA